MSREHPYRNFFTGAIIGSSLGAISALVATGKGKGLKKEIIKKYHHLKDELEHLSKEAFHYGQPKQLMKRAKKAAKKVAKKVKKVSRTMENASIKKLAKKTARKAIKKTAKKTRSRKAGAKR